MKNNTSRTAGDPYAQRILDEQLRTVHRHLLPILGVHLLVGGVMVAMLWRIFPGVPLRAWALALVAMVVLRFALYLHYRRHATPQTVRRHRRNFVFGAALSGVLWGLAGVLFFAPAFEHRLFVLSILVGMGAGAISSLTAYLPAFYAYFPVSLLPMSIMLVNSGQPESVGLGLMSLAFVVAMSYFGHNISRSLSASLRLRFENSELVRELAAQKEEAEQANVAKSRFLAAASHDLRQPLHSLGLYVSLLEDVAEAPRTRQLIGRIQRSVSSLRTLFEALLDISKLEAGTLVPEREDFPLQPLLDRLANDYAPEVTQKGLALTLQPSEEILRSDPSLLEQVLRNYLSNALRYTGRGRIRLDSRRTENGLRIDVTDTGPGIEAPHQKLIYEEFYQVGNPDLDRSEGVGLGLAIVARVARLLGHPIGVRSALGEGSTFWITVPLGQALPQHPTLLSGEHPSVPGAPQRPIRIVVIDDDPVVLESTQAALENWGCRTLVAVSLDEALRQLADAGSAPDGIIADYRLKDARTGIEAVRALRQRYGSIPAIVITGDTASEPLRALQESGLQALHKPVPPAKLRAFLLNVQRAASARARRDS
jgi:signal transduction histidine kinase/CheY-like chemotaxis protein